MSDQWEFFPRQMGEHLASVFVNVSIGDQLREIGRTGQVLVRLQLQDPRNDGLTTREEFEVLSELEDGFLRYCETSAATFVGRLTVGGLRDFVVYAEDAERVAHGLRTIAADEHGYEVETLVRDDPEFEVYWQHLYPTAVDWQLIQNGKLLEGLENLGDASDQARRIAHWVYFDAAEHRDQFAQRASSEGFRVAGRIEPSDADSRFGLQIFREDKPRPPEIHQVTVLLFRLAEEFSGEYDGWETEVIER